MNETYRTFGRNPGGTAEPKRASIERLLIALILTAITCLAVSCTVGLVVAMLPASVVPDALKNALQSAPKWSLIGLLGSIFLMVAYNYRPPTKKPNLFMYRKDGSIAVNPDVISSISAHDHRLSGYEQRLVAFCKRNRITSFSSGTHINSHWSQEDICRYLLDLQSD